ncbi:MAG TPA: hypothetical protein VL475_11010, partial [Planctomycetaceae bacterium]|nr:hypothetical protein [Planctomycetaceae bacterium]
MPLLRRVVLPLCLVAVVWALAAGSAQAALRAGAARKSIVPSFPTLMGGFYDRMKNFEGVHDEVFARAL